jgi:hypothetical protein
MGMHNVFEYTTCRSEKVLTRVLRGLGFARVLGVFLSFAGLSSALHQAQGITLFWDRATSDTNLSAYVVKYGVTSGSYTGQVSVAASQTSTTVNNLTPGLTYYFVVTAKDISNVESDPSNQISYSVPAVNTNVPPTLNPISSLTVAEDAGLQTVSLTGISPGAVNEPQTVTVTSVSSNPSLIPHPTVNYASPNSSGTLMLAPAVNAFGTATITVTANDGAASNNTVTRTFTVTVNPVNEPPTLDAPANLTIGRNAGLQTVNLSGITSGAANEVQTLTVTAASSNPSLIPTPSVTYTSPSSTGTLRFTPVANASGNANITVTVRDNAASNNVVVRSFVVTVSPSGTVPTVRVRVTPSRQVVLTVTGQPGHTLEIQATQNFTTWTVINTVTMGASGSMDVIDANAASFPRRFYRVGDTQ